MCIVIDACCISMVFDEKNQSHSEFAPVLKWLTKGNGKMVYGGEKYLRELRAAKKYHSIILELQRKGAVVILDSPTVDSREKEIRKRLGRSTFNDEHLLAIVVSSGCCVVCTTDKPAQQLVRNSDLYPKRMKRAKIYSSSKHYHLCCKRNIVGACVV